MCFGPVSKLFSLQGEIINVPKLMNHMVSVTLVKVICHSEADMDSMQASDNDISDD